MTGWWLSHPSEKYYIVNWDDDSQYMEKNIRNHQPDDLHKNMQTARVDMLIKKLLELSRENLAQ
jgi:hypothetical protein